MKVKPVSSKHTSQAHVHRKKARCRLPKITDKSSVCVYFRNEWTIGYLMSSFLKCQVCIQSVPLFLKAHLAEICLKSISNRRAFFACFYMSAKLEMGLDFGSFWTHILKGLYKMPVGLLWEHFLSPYHKQFISHLQKRICTFPFFLLLLFLSGNVLS